MDFSFFSHTLGDDTLHVLAAFGIAPFYIRIVCELWNIISACIKMCELLTLLF